MQHSHTHTHVLGDRGRGVRGAGACKLVSTGSRLVHAAKMLSFCAPFTYASCLRPMYLRPNSVFGVFLRRIRIACNGANFSRLALLLEDIVRYTDRLRGECTQLEL